MLFLFCGMDLHVGAFVFKVNEHLKDILEQEQKLKEHHTVEAPGGQKVRFALKTGPRAARAPTCAVTLGNVRSFGRELGFGDGNWARESQAGDTT